MSVTQTLQVVEIARSYGVPVTFEPGWDTRGNGQSSAYQGGIEHHTGGSYANTCPGILVYGRSDLSGPLCNFAGLANGGLHVVAAHPANHAGASGGPSNGPFPVTSLFNKLVMGLEICYPGNSPMTDAQYRTAKVFAKAMQIMFGSVERARGHRETSIEGKWDPGYAPGLTINMAALRSEAAAIQEEDELKEDERAALFRIRDAVNGDLAAINWRVHAIAHGRGVIEGGPDKGKRVETADKLYELLDLVRRLVALVPEGAPLPADDMGPVVAEGQELPLAASVKKIEKLVGEIAGHFDEDTQNPADLKDPA